MEAFAALIVLFLGVVICYAVYAFLLRLFWWLGFGRSGMRGLFFYSDNPNYVGFVEGTIVPLLPMRVVVTNLSSLSSRRAQSLLLSRIHAHWTGEKDHTPVAIVFLSFWKVRSVKLYRPTLKAVRGNTITLERQLQSMHALIGETGHAP